jgi:hypothetical protein
MAPAAVAVAGAGAGSDGRRSTAGDAAQAAVGTGHLAVALELFLAAQVARSLGLPTSRFLSLHSAATSTSPLLSNVHLSSLEEEKGFRGKHGGPRKDPRVPGGDDSMLPVIYVMTRTLNLCKSM